MSTSEFPYRNDTMSETSLDKSLPSNIEAERSVLGSILIDNRTFALVAPILTADLFYREAHRLIFSAIATLRAAKLEADIITLKDFLSREQLLDQVGGVAYVSSLVDSIPDIGRVEQYARIVLEKAALRSLVRTLNEELHNAIEGKENPVEISSRVIGKIGAMAVPPSQESRGMYTVLRELHDENDRLAEAEILAGIHTGLPGLDRHLYGLPRGVMTLVGAPTTHGKTTLALSMAIGALDAMPRIRVAFYSLEMGPRYIGDRVIATRSGLSMSRVQGWKWLSEIARHEVDQAREALKEWNQRFFFAHRLRDVRAIEADARKKKAEYGLDVLFVDYIQLVRGGDGDTKEQRINDAGQRLMELAEELDCAVVVNAQLKREAKHRPGRRLDLDDLKDCRALGDHARVVLLFHRPYEYDKSQTEFVECRTLLQIEKLTQGKKGDIELHFDGDHQVFTEGDCEANNCKHAVKVTGGKSEQLRI